MLTTLASEFCAIVAPLFGDMPGVWARQPSLGDRVVRYFQGLRAGDPVVWGITLVLLLIAAVILGVWAKVSWDFRREEKEKKRRRREEDRKTRRPDPPRTW